MHNIYGYTAGETLDERDGMPAGYTATSEIMPNGALLWIVRDETGMQVSAASNTTAALESAKDDAASR